MVKKTPHLFGLESSNRDFTRKVSWGKNCFNNSFPAALACYMFDKEIAPVYLHLDNELRISHGSISVGKIFALSPLKPDIHFSFEYAYTPYAHLVVGTLPGVDLVIQDLSTPHNDCIRALEIKLTALPDNTTCDQDESEYGTEIVVRPDTILYASLHIASHYQKQRSQLHHKLNSVCQQINNWQEPSDVRPYISQMGKALDDIASLCLDRQLPFLLQPIWKTLGKSSILADNCLDIFVWSDLAFIKLAALEASKERAASRTITRIERTVIWLTKILYDFAMNGKIDYRRIFDQLSYDTRNDKAFALSGKATHPYMASKALTTPRINKQALRHIILGGGQKLLSPERRFDAILVNSPELFLVGKES